MTARTRRARLTVGVDFHTWDGIFQGSRSHILGIYRAAIRQAPDADFVFFLQDTEGLAAAHSEFTAANVRLVRTPHRNPLVRLITQLPWLQWRHGIDVLHMQYRVPLIPVAPTVCTIHDVLFETHPQFFKRGFILQSKLTFRMASRMASALLTVSDYSRQELCRLYGLQPAQVAVTYNGVDRSRFHPAPGGEDVLGALGLQPGGYILNVGRLEPRKNQASLIRAWTQLGPTAPPLVLVGQRDFHFDEALQALAEVPHPERVILLENVSDAQLPALLRHALMFVYPAFAEGFGMPVAEAMASGVPVVTSNTTALPEVVGQAAVLVDPSDVASLRQGMAQLLDDATLRARLAAEGPRQAVRFDWHASAGVLMARIREVGARRR